MTPNMILSEILKMSNHWFKEETIKNNWNQFLEETILKKFCVSTPSHDNKISVWNLFYNTMIDSIEPLSHIIKEDSKPIDRRLQILIEERSKAISKTELNLHKLKDDVINCVFPILEGEEVKDEITDEENRATIINYSNTLKNAYKGANTKFEIEYGDGKKKEIIINLIKNYDALNKLVPNYIEDRSNDSFVDTLNNATKEIKKSLNNNIIILMGRVGVIDSKKDKQNQNQKALSTFYKDNETKTKIYDAINMIMFPKWKKS